MFKSARWRSDKNKIKTLFKLQFHATQGSSKASVLGEVSVDFAEYSEATKASSVSLPLKNSSAVLHVSIQKLQANADQREVEGCEDAKVKSQDNSLMRHLSNNDADESVFSGLDIFCCKVEFMFAFIDSQDETINRTTQNAECNRTASIGSDITLSSSDSSSGLDTSRELVLRNINNCHDPSNYLSSPNQPSIPHRPGVYGSTNNEQQQSQWEWSADSEHGVSSDGSTKSSQDNLLRERQADMSELELQTLRKQIVKESKKGHDLSREVVSLKEERDAFKAECEKLKPFSIGWMIQKQKQLQKTQESNAELILAVRDLEEILEQKNGEAANSNRSESTNDAAGAKSHPSREEVLRKTRLKNANTAERLQEEFRRLSSQMASTFDANEKVANESNDRSESELGAQKSHLEELLKKTKEELQASRDEYEAKLQKLSNELDEKTREMEQMLLEIQNKSMQLGRSAEARGRFL
ncbi:hypothetical protein J5N97_001905 [Dioscorea zingiberensis]|uniref:C2 NT-type domain-containing protein n=1 Tax=Dioscorea zingiberensis TaxID=325984 RepID=A0A9D5BT19_9LILI|nr:hypothetical protein J5N97_001905 [Dioscorea zingiberensis]